MKEIVGDFWEHAPRFQALCCTCNSTIKRDGSLVMGKGIALEFAKKFPTLSKEWGRRVADWEEPVFTTVRAKQVKVAGELEVRLQYLVYFRTKDHWTQPSNWAILGESFDRLRDLIVLLDLSSVLLPRPGCSNGGLLWSSVKEWIEERYSFAPLDRVTYIGKS